MAKDEYDILPHKLLEDLKYDVEALKQRLTEPENKANELILEIETLKDSVHELNTIFTKALDETKEEDVYKTISLLNERIDAVVTQNETIAKGMIAISDKLEDFMSRQGGSTLAKTAMAKPSGMIPPAPSPGLGPAPGMMPPSPPPMSNQMSMGGAMSDMPPSPAGMPMPPSPPKKKRGIFK